MPTLPGHDAHLRADDIQSMRPITLRLPPDTIEALYEIVAGQKLASPNKILHIPLPTFSLLLRTILRDFLFPRGYYRRREDDLNPNRRYPTRPKPGATKPITIRLPDDLIDALNQATQDDGRPSASDTVRYILREYLADRRTKLEIERRKQRPTKSGS